MIRNEEDSFVRCRWKETCLPPNWEPNQSTHRTALQFISGKHLDWQLLLCLFSKTPFLDEAVGKGLQSAYTTYCCAANINPHEGLLIVKDPTLVRADQLTCLNLLSACMLELKRNWIISFRKDWTQRTILKCEWRGVDMIAFIPSFSNYFVVSTSQNKSVTQLDVFLLILCFYRFFGFDLWWNLGIFFCKKHHKSTWVDQSCHCTKRGNKTISALRWLGVSDEKWRHQITWLSYFCWTSHDVTKALSWIFMAAILDFRTLSKRCQSLFFRFKFVE